MTIPGVSTNSGASQFALELDAGVTSMAGQLAVLVLNSEETKKELEREGLAHAREAYAAAVADEVEALRQQADKARLGAIVTGSLGIASAGLDVWSNVNSATNEAPSTGSSVTSATNEAPSADPAASTQSCQSLDWQKPAATGLGNLADPLGSYASHNYGAAHAKAAQGEREQAGWELEDRRAALDRADALQEKAMSWVEGLLQEDAAVAAAILSNLA